MNRNSKDRGTLDNLLTRRLQIPAWLVTIIAIVLGSAAIFERSEISNGRLLIILALLLLILGAFLMGKTSESEPDENGSADEITIYDEATPNHKMTLSRLPANVTPILLRIPDREGLKGLKKEGVGEILTISGNLVFQDRYKEGEWVTSFSSPVKLTFNYTEDDEQKAKEKDAEIIPVCLYTYPCEPEKPDHQIWKPFQTFSIDKARRTMTIEFLFWGDPPIGPGTKK